MLANKESEPVIVIMFTYECLINSEGQEVKRERERERVYKWNHWYVTSNARSAKAPTLTQQGLDDWSEFS